MIYTNLPDFFKDRLGEVLQEATLLVRKSVRPIYGRDEAGHLIHIASCVLISFEGRKFLITAAHVIDDAKTFGLEILCNEKYVDITGNVFITNKVEGSRDNDHFDFAWIDITGFKDDIFSDDCFLERTSANQVEGHFYMALGYPRTKNKPNRSLRSARARIFPYGNQGTLDVDHIHLGFEADRCRSDGKKVTAPHLYGMSGGGLFDLGNMADLGKINADSSVILSGIIIEYGDAKKRQGITAIKINTILTAITEHSDFVSQTNHNS